MWYVYDKAGTVTIYGENAASRLAHPDDLNKIYTWHFTRAVDLNGNYMSAVYDTSDYDNNHILYLKEIRYTGNTGLYGSSIPARQYVRFRLKDRDDAYISKATGFIVRMRKILDRIEIGWDDPAGSRDTELWHYDMVYGTSEDSGRPLLKTVESDHVSTEPEFVYEKVNNGLTWQTVTNSARSDARGVQYFEGDFNGDGRADMVFFNPSTGEWRCVQSRYTGGFDFPLYGSAFQGYDSPSKIQWFKDNATGDYNADGRSDIAFYLPETREFWVAESTGSGLSFRMYGRYTADVDIFRCEWFSGDYDGNGLSDAVLYDEATGDWIFMRNRYRSFEFIKFARNFKNLYRDDYTPDSAMNSGLTQDHSAEGRDRSKTHFFLGDFNGDGRTDISVYDSRDGRWWIARNLRDDTLGFRLEWELFSEFSAPVKALFSNDRFTGDFNGDGFSDFLFYDRTNRQWIIGETGEDAIDFKIYSQMPSSTGEVTRWLQGDFNGDSRSDIGFYSASTKSFRIGESTPEGFRYRIYDNFNYDSILDAPAPEDEIVPAKTRAAVPGQAYTTELEYEYDSNPYPGSGEIAFPGNFDGGPGLLINSCKTGRFYYIESGVDPRPEDNLSGIDLSGEDVKLLSKRPVSVNGRDCIFYYRKSSTDSFFKIYYSDADNAFHNSSIGEFNSITGFDIDKSVFFTGDFIDGSLIVLDDDTDPEFRLFTSWGTTALAIEGSISPSDLLDVKNYREDFEFFAGRFTAADSESYQILVADKRAGIHTWHLGTIDGESIIFQELGSAAFAQGYTGQYRVLDGGIMMYVTESGAGLAFHRVTVGDSYISCINYSSLPDVSFYNEYDHLGNPAVHAAGDVLMKAVFNGTEPDLEEMDAVIDTVDRDDLWDNIYSFNWTQGDFNGDGKTDIGFFNLKQNLWYFAQSSGNIPDVMVKVRNGIGGTYTMEYINSCDVDNTGSDGIPDLGVNYRLCSRTTSEDGLGNRMATTYQYKNGFAYNVFVNGERESDFFGFSEFTVSNSLGQRSVNYYNTTPYADFKKNRALAGAIKKTVFLGSDNKEYSKTEYDYNILELKVNGTTKSYIVEASEKRSYSEGILVSTVNSSTELVSGGYALKNKTESATDHYADAAHAPVTVSSYSEYESIEDTNETRIILRKTLRGTAHENTVSYVYDSRGNLINRVASYTGSGLADPPDIDIEYTYDDYGNCVKTANRSAAPYRESSLVLDDDMHQFVRETRVKKGTGSGDYLAVSYILNYDSAFGAAARVTDENGNSVYYTYDSIGRLTRVQADTDSGTDTLSDYTYNTAFPLSAKTTQYSGTDDPDIETAVYFDGLGRAIHTVKSGLDEPGKRFTKTGLIVYDNAGRVIKAGQNDWAGDNEIDKFYRQSTLKNPTIFEYDGAGRKRKTTYPAASAGESETSVTITYNAPYEVIETHSIGRGKRTIANGRGQALYVQDFGTPSAGSGTGAFNTAAVGFVYDIAGNMVKKMDLTPNPPQGGDLASLMDLNIPDNAFTQGYKDSSGKNCAYWKYDGFGRLTASSDPDLGYKGYSYNEFGDLVTFTDALGRTTAHTYDIMGRLIQKDLPAGDGSVVYSYDSLSGCDNALGRLVAVDDIAQRKVFSYDRMGRRKDEKRYYKDTEDPDANITFETNYDSDLLGRTTRVIYPYEPRYMTRAAVEYSYNSMGLIQSVTGFYGADHDTPKTIISGIQYNEFGQSTNVAYGNGITTDYDYDIRGRLTSLVSHTVKNGETQYLQKVNYTFNIDNSIKQVENTPTLGPAGEIVKNTTNDYSYDGLNRLSYARGKSEDGFGTNSVKFAQAFEYAPNGNMLAKEERDYDSGGVDQRSEYDYAMGNHAVTNISCQLPSPGTRFVMEYDAVGNMTYKADNQAGTARAMAYDSMNRIKQVTDPDGNTVVGEYLYDEGGFRVRKVSRMEQDGAIVEHDTLHPSMYMGIEKQKDADGDEIEDTYCVVNNIYVNGVRVAAMMPNGKSQFFLTDQVDSVKVVADDSADVVSTTEYMPYGETWITQGSEDSKPKFNGQEYDKESGLYYYNARHYAPDIARFASPDTVIDGALSTQGWNRYAYCGNNPVMYKDPTGHWGVSAGFICVVGYDSENGFNVGVGGSFNVYGGTATNKTGNLGYSVSYVYNTNGSRTASVGIGVKGSIEAVSINIGLGYSYNTVSGHTANGCIGASIVVGVEIGGSRHWNKEGQYMGSSIYAKGYVGDCFNNYGAGYEYGTGTCKSGWFTSVTVAGVTANAYYYEDGSWGVGGSYDSESAKNAKKQKAIAEAIAAYEAETARNNEYARTQLAMIGEEYGHGNDFQYDGKGDCNNFPQLGVAIMGYIKGEDLDVRQLFISPFITLTTESEYKSNPGYLAFIDWTGDGRIDHVVTSIGDGNSIHPSSSQKEVIIMQSRSNFYMNTYSNQKVYYGKWNWDAMERRK